MTHPDAMARGQRLTLAAMSASQAMILLDITIVNVALPSIQRELGVSASNLMWIVGAYTLVLAALILVGGALGDRFGRRKIFLVGLAIFTAASVGCALAPDDPELIAFRALQGVGGAAMSALTLSILVDAYPAERRTAAIGLWAAIGGVGFGLGPVVGGVLIQIADWSAVFWVNVPIGAVCAVLTIAGVRESRDPSARRLDPVGAVLAALGLFLLTFSLIESNRRAWTSAPVAGTLAGAVVVLGAFVLWEQRAPSPMVPLQLLRGRRFASANAVYGLLYLALAGMLFFVTLYYQNLRGWSALKTGTSWLIMNVAFLLVSLRVGRLVKRLGGRPMVGGGCLMAAAGMFVLAFLQLDTSFWVTAIGYLLVGLGFGSAVPLVSSEAMSDVPGPLVGVGSGILNSTRQVGASVGLAVMGAIGVGIATHTWDHKVQSLPASVQAEAHAARQDVAGARPIHLGTDAQSDADDAFMTGYHWAMAAAGVAIVGASGAAFAGLRSRTKVAEAR
jgi:MFS transporter, DHA2 family, methylenomycin A resistance protein